MYTREKRSVVSKIYATIIECLPKLDTSSSRMVREDLEHVDWDDSHMRSRDILANVVSLQDSPLSKKPRVSKITEIDIEQADIDIPPIAPAQANDADMLDEADESHMHISSERISADLVAPPLGPLQVYFRLHATTSKNPLGGFTKTHKTHLFGQNFISVGDGWDAPLCNIAPLSPSDYRMEPQMYSFCRNCFKNYSLPSDWSLATTVLPVESNTDQEDVSSGSETPSLDTESEAEAVKLP